MPPHESFLQNVYKNLKPLKEENVKKIVSWRLCQIVNLKSILSILILYFILGPIRK